MLETLRLYAGEELGASGEAEAVAECHARHFIKVFDRAERSWDETPDLDWIALYQPELGNLRAALDWALAEPGRQQIAVALAASGCRLLEELYLIAEGRKYLDRIIPLIGQDTPPVTIANLLRHATEVCRALHDPAGLAYAERAAMLYRELDDQPNVASALTGIGAFFVVQNRHVEAKAVLQEAQSLLAGRAFKKRQLSLLNILGSVSNYMNNYAEARQYFTQALDVARTLKSTRESMYLANLAWVEFTLGNTDRAIELEWEATSRARYSPGQRYLGHMLGNLAEYLLVSDKLSEARPVLEEAMSLLVTQGNYSAISCLQCVAVLEAAAGCVVAAAQLTGFVDAERARHGENDFHNGSAARRQTLESAGDRRAASRAGGLQGRRRSLERSRSN